MLQNDQINTSLKQLKNIFFCCDIRLNKLILLSNWGHQCTNLAVFPCWANEQTSRQIFSGWCNNCDKMLQFSFPLNAQVLRQSVRLCCLASLCDDSKNYNKSNSSINVYSLTVVNLNKYVRSMSKVFLLKQSLNKPKLCLWKIPIILWVKFICVSQPCSVKSKDSSRLAGVGQGFETNTLHTAEPDQSTSVLKV